MSDRPIIFNGPMVRAIQREIDQPGTGKTQTRRLAYERSARAMGVPGVTSEARMSPWARLEPGDRLWAREAFGYGCRPCPFHGDVDGIEYRADMALMEDERDGLPLYTPETPADFCYGDVAGGGWRSPIHMPRWASRITLLVTDVRVERLQEISAKDSLSEGVECETCVAMRQSACNRMGCFASIDAFRVLWTSLHGPGAWEANPWVAAITFRPVLGNIDQIGEAA